MQELARSDLRTERSGKVLGNLWSVLNPLFQAGIYYFLYTVLRSRPGQRLPAHPDRQLLLLRPEHVGSRRRRVLAQAGQGPDAQLDLPAALLPVTTIYKSLRSFVPAACVLVVLFPLVGGTLGPGLFVLPLLFAIQVVMNVGIALLVSTYVVLVPDGDNVVQWVTRLLFFATPVIYPVALLPPAAKAVLQFQPLYPVFAATRRSSAAASRAPAWW